MKSNNILSTDLPEIDNSVKECVNFGEWLLFKSHQSEAKAAFYLKTGANFFALDNRGGVTEEIKNTAEKMTIDEVYYFSDLPKPCSLSNQRPIIE